MKILLLLLSTIVVSNGIKCNFTYQEDLDSYPERVINRIVSRKRVSFARDNGAREFRCDEDDDDTDDDLESASVLKRLNTFHTNKSARPSSRQPPTSDVETRFGSTDATNKPKPFFDDDDDDGFSDPICPVKISRIFPQTLPNIFNKLVVVVNHGKFRQEVTIERCSNVSQPCNFSENFPYSVVTKCKQKYLSQTLKVFSDSDQTQTIVDEDVYYPSGCECRVYPAKNKSTYKN